MSYDLSTSIIYNIPMLHIIVLYYSVDGYRTVRNVFKTLF